MHFFICFNTYTSFLNHYLKKLRGKFLKKLEEKKMTDNISRSSTICLFDVDGTLTYPRQVVTFIF